MSLRSIRLPILLSIAVHVVAFVAPGMMDVSYLAPPEEQRQITTVQLVQRTPQQVQQIVEVADDAIAKQVQETPVIQDSPVDQLDIAPVVVDAMAVQNPKPYYPRAAVRKGFEGTVVFKVKVSPMGAVEAAEILHSSGYKLLDSEAKKTIIKWVFAPATKNGKPTESWVNIPITFDLQTHNS